MLEMEHTSLARWVASARPSQEESRDIGLNELSWSTYTPWQSHNMSDVDKRKRDIVLTRWFVRRLSTCLSQHADQMSLQINLIASNVSVNNGLSRHNLV